MKLVNYKRVGTFPDFGNFIINREIGEKFDRYKGIKLLKPFATGVSAKSNDFDAEGNETKYDFYRIIKIVQASGFKGYFGIEYEGSIIFEKDGIIATKKLLEKVFESS